MNPGVHRNSGNGTVAIGGMISWSYVLYRPHSRLSTEEQMAHYALRIVGAP